MKFNTGDQVQIINGCWKGKIGKIDSISTTSEYYWVEFDHQTYHLINTEDLQLMDDQLPIGSQPQLGYISCECGSTILGSDRHSDYCRLYVK